jgi:hypothetical protein
VAVHEGGKRLPLPQSGSHSGLSEFKGLSAALTAELESFGALTHLQPPHTIMTKILWIALLGISSVAALAQAPASGQRDEMKKLDWLVGQWNGTGWMQLGPQGRKEFTITETVQGKLDGLVLVIEGNGKSKEDGRAVHTALAFVSYDEGAKTFRWRAFTAEGRQTDTVAKVGANTLEWGLEIPDRGRMRYTIKLNEKGEWFEVGEMTQDGETWRKFFEMTLQRQK